MRKSLPKLILLIALIALLIVLAIRLWRGVLDLIGAISGSGNDTDAAIVTSVEDIWTPPPYYADEQDFDTITGVREYAEPTGEP